MKSDHTASHVSVGNNPKAPLSQEEKPSILAQVFIKIDKTEIFALIDSGCSTSCIAEEEIQKSPFLQNCTFCPQKDIGHSINGVDVITLGLLRIPFSLKDTHFVEYYFL